MKFADFQLFRQQALADCPGLLDLAETNIWRSLSALVPDVDSSPAQKVHRCHLAEAWLDIFQLPPIWAKRAFVTGGVRNGLSLLLSQFAREAGTLLLPQDVYPVYGQLAAQTGIACCAYPTIPHLDIPVNGRWLLIPNPMKPAGRWLNFSDLDLIIDWLSNDLSRRVLIDAVYNFENNIHPTSLRILETGQAFLLHSLSKAWLTPQVMGICLTPDSDWDSLVSPLRACSPDPPHLQRAQALMRHWRDLPSRVHLELADRRRRVQEMLPIGLPVRNASHGDDEAGYLFPVRMDFRQLKDRHGILAIPLSVFGSHKTEYSIVSSLRCV